MKYFKDKIAIVTGGASGLGRSLSLQLGKHGAQVIVVDIDQEGAEHVVDQINKEEGKAIYAFMDVTIAKNAQRIVYDISRKFGRLDLIFNNAGTAIQGETRDLSIEQWETVININLMGVIYSATAAYQAMEKQGKGQIVNIGSLAGLIPVPKEIPYCTSKWAVVGFTHALRVEGEDLGIKVNLVCPGIMKTPIHDKIAWVNVNKDQLVQPKLIKFFMGPESAAERILQGVVKNKAVIVFPFYAKICWILYRLVPGLFQFAFTKVIRDFRKSRLSD